MKRHALLEIMVEASIQLKTCKKSVLSLAVPNLVGAFFSYSLDNITEIPTSFATNPRLRAGVVSLYVLHSPEATGFRN